MKNNEKACFTTSIVEGWHEAQTLRVCQLGNNLFVSNASYSEIMIETVNLRNDSLIQLTFGFGWPDSVAYYNDQAGFNQSSEIVMFDSITNSVVMVPDFELILNKIKCPVLAIFGEKDFVVDWKKTKSLYESTLGKNASLTIKTFKNGNHEILKCQTGMFNESLEKREVCPGYLVTMGDWLGTL